MTLGLMLLVGFQSQCSLWGKVKPWFKPTTQIAVGLGLLSYANVSNILANETLSTTREVVNITARSNFNEGAAVAGVDVARITGVLGVFLKTTAAITGVGGAYFSYRGLRNAYSIVKPVKNLVQKK